MDSILEHTPLHRAVDGGDKCADVVQLLTETESCRSAMLNKTDSSGFTPLCVAATTGSIKFCSLLLNKGADVSVVAEKGDTCLSVACKHAQLEVIDLLLNSELHGGQAKVDPKAVYESFKRKNNNSTILNKLLVKDSKGEAIIPENAFLQSTGIQHNKLIGMNAVHFAAEVDDASTLLLLIQHGVPTGLAR